MELPNRKQRRQWAKQLGYLEKKKNISFKTRMQLHDRAIENGKLIHNNNVERVLRSLEAQQEKRNQTQIDKLVDSGMSPEDALKQITED